MLSMTGYGRGTVTSERLDIVVEIASVNRKGLELNVSLPREWQAMEREISDRIRSRVNRGKVNVSLSVKDLQSATGLNWDNEIVRVTYQRLKTLAVELGAPFEANAQTLIEIIKALETKSELPSVEDAQPTVMLALEGALEAFVGMRQTEGDSLHQDISSRIKLLAGFIESIRTTSEGTVTHYREQLLERLQKANLELNLDDERVLKEIALFADRADVTEELTRFLSHLEQFTETMQSNDAVGRKLDFLCQEIHRETNTIGSKANNIEITRLVIEIKNELERIREQVQNIE